MSVQSIVSKIIVEKLGVDASQVTSEARYVEDLAADSLDLVELREAIEDAEAESLTTVGATIAWAERKP